MNITHLDFRQLVVIFVSLGPHKQRELAQIGSVSADTVAGWYHGTARPHRHKENHLKHYLLSKLSDWEGLLKEREGASRAMKQAEKQVIDAEAKWDSYISKLPDEEAAAKAEKQKSQALSHLRRQLSLPSQRTP